MLKNKFFLSILLISCVLCLTTPLWGQRQSDLWDGPTNGPLATPGKTVAFVASDFKNGGVVSTFWAFKSAIDAIGWKNSRFDGNGDIPTLKKVFSDALASHPDAIVLGGFQPDDVSDQIEIAQKRNIVLVGWHAAANPGPTKDLFVNVATNSATVAKTAAQFVIKQSRGRAGVIIFNDSRFAVANTKTAVMKNEIAAAKGCKVLEVVDMAISRAASEIPDAVKLLNAKYGKSWTHSLAINDVYFDNMNIPLISIGRRDIINVSAGDGSSSAINRIIGGRSQQAATIAEPLGAQGWQLVDELNRAFAKAKPSGYVSKPLLITSDTMDKLSPTKSEAPYQKAYIAIWHNR
jgi:ribose transport system substrate-binding protein